MMKATSTPSLNVPARRSPKTVLNQLRSVFVCSVLGTALLAAEAHANTLNINTVTDNRDYSVADPGPRDVLPGNFTTINVNSGGVLNVDYNPWPDSPIPDLPPFELEDGDVLNVNQGGKVVNELGGLTSGFRLFKGSAVNVNQGGIFENNRSVEFYGTNGSGVFTVSGRLVNKDVVTLFAPGSELRVLDGGVFNNDSYLNIGPKADNDGNPDNNYGFGTYGDVIVESGGAMTSAGHLDFNGHSLEIQYGATLTMEPGTDPGEGRVVNNLRADKYIDIHGTMINERPELNLYIEKKAHGPLPLNWHYEEMDFRFHEGASLVNEAGASIRMPNVFFPGVSVINRGRLDVVDDGYNQSLTYGGNTVYHYSFSAGHGRHQVGTARIPEHTQATFENSNVMIVDVRGNEAGNGYDQIQVAGSLQLGGRMEIRVDNPGLMTLDVIVSETPLSGSFTSVKAYSENRNVKVTSHGIEGSNYVVRIRKVNVGRGDKQIDDRYVEDRHRAEPWTGGGPVPGYGSFPPPGGYVLQLHPDEVYAAVDDAPSFYDGTSDGVVRKMDRDSTGYNSTDSRKDYIPYPTAAEQAALPDPGVNPEPADPFAPSVSVDTDGDDLDDDFEQQIIDANPSDGINALADVDPNGDFDGDGNSNLMEQILGYDPTDPSEAFRWTITSLDPAAGQIQFTCSEVKPGVAYHVYRTTSLMVPRDQWSRSSTLIPTVTEQNKRLQVTDPAIGTERRMFWTLGFEPAP